MESYEKILKVDLGFVHQGGLATAEDVSAITTKAALCSHVALHWNRYLKQTLKWQGLSFMNGDGDMPPARVLNGVAGTLLDMDAETLIHETSLRENIEPFKFAKAIAACQMLTKHRPIYSFPQVFEERCRVKVTQ